jgi:hypothetical protein
MGRKSSAKKQRRIDEDKIDKQKKQPKKLKEKIKKIKKVKIVEKKVAADSTEKLATEKTSKKHHHPQKIFGTLLVLILGTLLVVVAAHLFQKGFRPTPVADLIPEDKVSAFLEISTYQDHTQLTKAIALLEGTEYSQENLKTLAYEKFHLHLEDEVPAWLGRQIAAVEFESDPEKPLQTVYFVETINRNSTINYLKEKFSTKESIDENNSKIYTIETEVLPIHAGILKDYLVFSIDKKSIEILLSPTNETATKVSSTDDYGTVQSHMPYNVLAFLYINQNTAYDKLLSKFNEISGSSLYSTATTPFQELTLNQGFTLSARDDHFEIISFLKFSEPYLKGNKYISKRQRYSAELTSLIPADVEIFWGGQNIDLQSKKLISVLSEGAQSTSEVFEGVIQNYIEKYLGPSVSLEEDVYPLLQNEFAFAMTRETEAAESAYSFILELDNSNEDLLRIQKIANNFASIGAVFEPHVVEFELEDGTKTKEIVATQEDLEKTESTYADIPVYEMTTIDKSWGAYYSIYKDKLIISTAKDELIRILELALGEPTDQEESPTSLANSPTYQIHILPALSSSEDVLYVDVSEYLPETKLIKTMSAGRDYFSDGIEAQYYINVE